MGQEEVKLTNKQVVEGKMDKNIYIMDYRYLNVK